MIPSIPCAGCGALVPDVDGPTHAYIGASPGCWALFGEVLAREFSDSGFWRAHQLTVDTYAVQHPGQPERRSIQSVAVHLIAIHLYLEREFDDRRVMWARREGTKQGTAFTWLDPPASMGPLTVLDVHRAGTDAAEHFRLVHAWAHSTWEAWAQHHGKIRHWASLILGE